MEQAVRSNAQILRVVSFCSFSAKKLTQLLLFSVFQVSELLNRIEQEQDMGPQYGIGMQAFSITSPETTVKKETGTVGILSNSV